MRRLNHGGEGGAIAIIVAVLMVLLLGVATFVIDVGSLYAERRQLQNGADSAALAVALDCAKTTCAGSSSALATATLNADANANDGTATVTQVCGTFTGLSACSPAPQVAAWDCPPQPSTGPLATAPYVLVRTQTLSGGTNLLPPVFARVVVSGYTGATVKACARVGFGTPSSATTLAITESLCEWNAATSNGTIYAPAPPYPPNPAASYERVIYSKDSALAGSCPAGPSGADLPGGFGFLDDPDGDCSTTVSTSGTYGADTGASAGACKNAIIAAQASKSVIYLPVYSSATGTGTNGVYTLKGFAAFVVTGYRFPSISAASWITGKAPCKSPNTCISGFFTHGLIPSGGTVGSGTSLGATVIQLTG